MSEFRTFGTEEQIAVIDGAVKNGWSITGVTIDEHFGGSVTFAKTIKEPEHLFNGDTVYPVAPTYTTVTQQLGCTYEAMQHARRIMIEGGMREFSADEEFFRNEVRASDTIMAAGLSGLAQPITWGKLK